MEDLEDRIHKIAQIIHMGLLVLIVLIVQIILTALDVKLGENAMTTLQTWDGRSIFSYTGSIQNGTIITYGQNRTIIVTGDQYNALLNHFKGRTVKAGTSRTNPPKDSVGYYLQLIVTPVAISSYVCPILIAEGYAEKVGRSEIKFLER